MSLAEFSKFSVTASNGLKTTKDKASIVVPNCLSKSQIWWEGPKASDGNEPEDLPRYR
jgi:hypothetical protein